VAAAVRRVLDGPAGQRAAALGAGLRATPGPVRARAALATVTGGGSPTPPPEPVRAGPG
jgi:hypothetical protein